jgi:hypothetical protein
MTVTLRAFFTLLMLIVLSGSAFAQYTGDLLVRQALEVLTVPVGFSGQSGLTQGYDSVAVAGSAITGADSVHGVGNGTHGLHPVHAAASATHGLHPVHAATVMLNDGLPVKCLTPHFIYVTETNPVHPQAEAVLQAFTEISEAEIQDVQFHFSPSGRFRFEYTVIGTHAVPAADLNNSGVPDYVERAGIIADESYELMVLQQGFTDFLLPGQPYEFRFRQINSYGFTQSQGATSFIVVHRNFQGFPPNDDPEGVQIGALKVTIAHEMKHAIQYAASRWSGETGRVDWVEMDATMMEEVVYDEVNDYYNYIRGQAGIFGNPNRSTPVAYDHVTWKLYFYERFGIGFWVDIWDLIRANPQGTTMIGLITSQLAGLGYDFDAEFTRNHKWHFASNLWRVPGFGFDEAAAYPQPRRTFQTALIDTLRQVPGQTNRRAAQYLFFDDISSLVGNVQVTLTFDGDRAGLGIIGYRPDGRGDTWYGTAVRSEGAGVLMAAPPMQWQDYTSLVVIVANPTEQNQIMHYSISARELPERLTLYQNYPNPFNPRTTISFALTEPAAVTLEVYDLTGRRVVTLISGESLTRGFYDIPFDARSLSSGVYISILRVGRLTRVGKMTLVR